VPTRLPMPALGGHLHRLGQAADLNPLTTDQLAAQQSLHGLAENAGAVTAGGAQLARLNMGELCFGLINRGLVKIVFAEDDNGDPSGKVLSVERNAFSSSGGAGDDLGGGAERWRR
jgi:hypothetical protein